MFWLAILAVAAALAICIDSHIAPVFSLDFPTFETPTADAGPVRSWDRLRLSSQYVLFSLLTLAITLSKAASKGLAHVG
jgi:hypothetical protein